jgi:hypothetical protein
MKKKILVLAVSLGILVSALAVRAYDFEFSAEACLDGCNLSYEFCIAYSGNNRDLRDTLRCTTAWQRCTDRCFQEAMQ